MSLADDLMPPRPDHRRTRRTKALGRRCRSCGDRTMRGSTRCAVCAQAEYRMAGSRLPVTCWCEDTTVWCGLNLITAGLTRSCGLEHCTPELVAA